MLNMNRRVPVWMACSVVGLSFLTASPVPRTEGAEPWPAAIDADSTLAAYFAGQTEEIARAADTRRFEDLKQWKAEQPRLRLELADMLGLAPLPERTPLEAEVTGTIEQDGIVVERLHFQALPGLYVTANLYRPQDAAEPLPTILYVCGHSNQIEKRDGVAVSFGNKAGYQRHGAWFARHGYVCLIIDTIQLGEFLGLHHGTHREGRWDWMTQGYTPAGVETWCGIRALDYLETRPEVDAQRMGMTGRSGGGAYSWYVAAMDERVRVVAPVAGITDLQDHVVNGCVSGHCDCMYMINYHRWDYPQMAALIAPRPLLIANSDNDGIFPLQGVWRTAEQVRHVYRLHDAEPNLGLLITPGPHKDTPELQVGVFRWMDRHLKNVDQPVDEAAVARFDRTDLRVFESLPADERVTTVQDYFVGRLQQAEGSAVPGVASVPARLREQSLAGWPDRPEPLDAQQLWERDGDGTQWELWEFTSQTPFRLRAIVARPSGEPTRSVVLHLVDSQGWQEARRRAEGEAADEGSDSLRVYLAVRGTGPHAWTGSDADQRHIQRSFYLLGQTLAGMQVWDALRGVEFCQTLHSDEAAPLAIKADRALMGVGLFATGLAGQPVRADGLELPEDYQTSTALLGAGRVAGLEAWLQTIPAN